MATKNNYSKSIKFIDGLMDNTGEHKFPLIDARDIYVDDTHRLSNETSGSPGALEMIEADLATTYDASVSYIVGDYCLYDHQLYRCTTAGANHTPAVGSSYWTATNVMAEAGSGVGNSIAEAFATNKTYAVGDYVVYQRKLYRCTSAVETAGDWTGTTNWIEAILANDVADLKSAFYAVSPILADQFIFRKNTSETYSVVFDNGGYYFKSDGTRHVNAAKQYVGSIAYPLLYGAQKVTTNCNVTGAAGHIFLNENMEYVSGFDGGTVNVPVTARFVAFSDYNSNATHTGKTFTIEYDSSAVITPSVIADINSSIEAIAGEIEPLQDFRNNLSIEGYKREYASMEGTTKQNYVRLNTNGQEYGLTGWAYSTYECNPGDILSISGYSGSAVSLYLFADENDNILFYYPFPSGNTAYIDIDAVAPVNTAKVFVNGNPSYQSPVAKKSTNNFEKDSAPDSSIGIETSENTWKIGTGKMQTTVSLYGSKNGTFRYDAIDYDGSTFKLVTDDIAPINLYDPNYVGANHGYYFVYKATLTSHGLTTADIGKTCVIDGETWVLLQVNSANIFTVCCYSADNWWGMKLVEPVPTVFDFGNSITVTAIEREQLYPSVNHVNVRVLENTDKRFCVAESYNIISPKSGIDAIILNVGDNDNNSVAELSDPLITVRNLYSFDKNCFCSILQSIKLLSSIKVNFYGATQSQCFGSYDYFAVPMTNKDLLTATSTSEETRFARSMWDDSTKPPIIYLQTDNTGASSNKMLLQGIFVTNRNAQIYSEAGWMHTSRKMYPFAIEPRNTMTAGTTDFMSVRFPMYKNEMSEDVKFCGFATIGKDFYLFVYNNETVSASISLPIELLGKTVETVISKNATCETTTTVTGIDVAITGEGYLFLKLS